MTNHHIDFIAIQQFLSNHVYPAAIKDKGQKVNFRRRCKNFRLRDGQLIYSASKFGAVDRVVVFNQDEQKRIISSVHQGFGDSSHAKSMSCHYGRDATYEKISKRYYWNGMLEDVGKFIHECEICQKNCPKFDKSGDTLHSIPIPKEVMQQLGVDLCQLPNVDGYTYLAVAIDYFTKWSEASALKEKTAESVASFLWNLICRHGCFSIQINDQGREFINDVSAHLHRMTGVKQRVTSAYHPQANGLVERQNRTIKNSLVKCLEGNPKKWPYVIEGVLFAHRVSKHASTGYSPFFLLYNREPKLPIDIDLNSGQNRPSGVCRDSNDDSDIPFDMATFQSALKFMLSIRSDIHDKASSNIQRAQKRQKLNYERRHASKVALKEGDDVLMKNMRRKDRKGGKFSDQWLGPYTIHILQCNGTVTLKTKKGSILLRKANISNLKLFSSKDNRTENNSVASDIDNEEVIGCVSKKRSNISNSSDERIDASTSDCNSDLGQESLSKHDKRETKKKMKTKSFFFQYTPLSNMQASEIAKKLDLRRKGHRMQVMGSKDLGPPNRQHHIRGDGNCFFRAVSYVISGTEDNHSQIRDLVVHRMQTNPLKQCLENYLSTKMATYLDNTGMMMDGVWATDAEILATSFTLGIDIMIYGTHGNDRAWLRFNLAECEDNACVPLVPLPAIYLISTGDHFNVVNDVSDAL